jgi:NAD(P)-dependent dehydrogenase (short-subunit alcohol dehydrogenase family)
MTAILKDRVVLVTGAGRGLGWGIARSLGKAGASVCATDINMEELARSGADLKSDGSQYVAERLDAGDLANFERVVAQTVARWGRLDAIVHCAILMPLIRFEDTSPELWWRQLRVSMGGMFNAARASWEVMKQQGGGHLIGIASGSSIRGFKDETTYCAGKHGQEGFVKALSLESAPCKIAVNTMGPGKPIKTTRVTWDEFDHLPADQKQRWADPVGLGEGFVWLVAQPPERYSGYRFDAGTIADTIAREGFDFAFAPEKVKLSPTDFVERKQWYDNYRD